MFQALQEERRGWGLHHVLLTFSFQHKSHWRRQQINPDFTLLLAVEIRIYYKKWETDYTSKHIWPQTGLQVIQKEARNTALFTARHLQSHTAAGVRGSRINSQDKPTTAPLLGCPFCRRDNNRWRNLENDPEQRSLVNEAQAGNGTRFLLS